MTNQFKVGQKVTLINRKPSYDAFSGLVYSAPKVGDVLRVERLFKNGDVVCSFRGYPNSQVLHQKDISPLIVGSTAVITEATEKSKEISKTTTPQQPTAEMTKKVLKLLQSKGTTTPIECSAVLKCRAVPYQIHTLRKLGWKIKSELKNDPIDGQRYVRYHLLDQEVA